MRPKYLAIAVAMTVAGQVALAKGAHGRSGGSSGGHARSSSGGGGHRASARGTSASSHDGRGGSGAARSSSHGGAEGRHPVAGTGRGTSFYRPYSYRPYYSNGYSYRPYYNYYRPRYRPYSSGSLYLGSYYYDPFYYGGYGPDYYPPYSDYDYGYRASVAGEEGPEREGYARYDDRDVMRRDDRDNIPRDVSRDSGELRLRVSPPDATIYVDGRFQGTARESGSLSLAPGRHTIEAVRPGYRIEQRDVEIGRGDLLELSIELQRQ